jgi:hypothetical protein
MNYRSVTVWSRPSSMPISIKSKKIQKVSIHLECICIRWWRDRIDCVWCNRKFWHAVIRLNKFIKFFINLHKQLKAYCIYDVYPDENLNKHLFKRQDLAVWRFWIDVWYLTGCNGWLCMRQCLGVGVDGYGTLWLMNGSLMWLGVKFIDVWMDHSFARLLLLFLLFYECFY